MAGDEGIDREELAVVEMDVGPAHPRDPDAQSYLSGAGDGVSDLGQPQLSGTVVHNGVHGKPLLLGTRGFVSDT
jgi:hypothetical protein